jgi:cobalt-zinc-cadmium efflux system protein
MVRYPPDCPASALRSTAPGVGNASARSFGGSGAHGHVTVSSDSRYIAIALGPIVGFLAFEVIVAFAGHSLALLADAGHVLTDAGAPAASLVAIRLGRRPAPGPGRSTSRPGHHGGRAS